MNPCSSILYYFEDLKDPRVDRTKFHKLGDIITIAICSIICVGESYTDMEEFGHAKLDWLSTFLELPNGIPSHDTFNRFFRALEPESFTACFSNWVSSVRRDISEDIVAIDGKTLRRSFDRANEESAVHIVSAWSKENNLSLGQVAVDDKSNEIVAIPKLLKLLDLQDCIVTIDAIGCQKEIARQICDEEADYVLELKKNHPTFFNEVQSFFLRHRGEKFYQYK